MNIRRATSNDIVAIQNIAKVTWAQAYEGIIPLDIQKTFLLNNYSEIAMRNRLDRSVIFVAEKDGMIYGFANFFALKQSADEAELGAIYILPELQFQGVGGNLLNAGIDELKGIRRLFVVVEKENIKGFKFYDSKGFVFVNVYEEQLHGHTLKLVKMVLEISQ
jgi:GNAT superfamily N-acetyltransferase